jgi:hypothetical protein
MRAVTSKSNALEAPPILIVAMSKGLCEEKFGWRARLVVFEKSADRKLPKDLSKFQLSVFLQLEVKNNKRSKSWRLRGHRANKIWNLLLISFNIGVNRIYYIENEED